MVHAFITTVAHANPTPNPTDRLSAYMTHLYFYFVLLCCRAHESVKASVRKALNEIQLLLLLLLL